MNTYDAAAEADERLWNRKANSAVYIWQDYAIIDEHADNAGKGYSLWIAALPDYHPRRYESLGDFDTFTEAATHAYTHAES